MESFKNYQNQINLNILIGSDNHGTERIEENYISINYTLSKNDNGTQLNLEQSNLLSDEMVNMMDGVWDFLLGNLKKHIEAR